MCCLLCLLRPRTLPRFIFFLPRCRGSRSIYLELIRCIDGAAFVWCSSGMSLSCPCLTLFSCREVLACAPIELQHHVLGQPRAPVDGTGTYFVGLSVDVGCIGSKSLELIRWNQWWCSSSLSRCLAADSGKATLGTGRPLDTCFLSDPAVRKSPLPS